jgi:hypothetical protein
MYCFKINFVLKFYFASIVSVRLYEEREDSNPYLWLTDPEGPKTCGSCGSGSLTLLKKLTCLSVGSCRSS